MFQIKEFTSRDFTEPLGTKEKFWTNNGEYLFKIGRENTLEDCSEKIAYEIAKIINLPSAEYELAIYKNGLERKGIASKKISDYPLIHGNEILGDFDKNYDKTKTYKAKQYSLQMVYEIMKFYDETRNFIGYLVFDMLIGNQDRHHENWGFIKKNNQLKLAPSFDHASGLASKVSDTEACNRLKTKDKNYMIESFCLKAVTPFYKDDKKLKTLEVVKELLILEKESVLFWINKIAQIDSNQYDRILNKIPKDFAITDNQKEFIKKMLKINTQQLRELKGT